MKTRSESPAYGDIRNRSQFPGGSKYVSTVRREFDDDGKQTSKIIVYELEPPHSSRSPTGLVQVAELDGSYPWWSKPDVLEFMADYGKTLMRWPTTESGRWSFFPEREVEHQRVGGTTMSLDGNGKLYVNGMAIVLKAARPVLLTFGVYYRLSIAPGRTTTDMVIAHVVDFYDNVIAQFTGGEGKHVAFGEPDADGNIRVLRGDGNLDVRTLGPDGWVDRWTLLADAKGTTGVLAVADPFWVGDRPGYIDRGGNIVVQRPNGLFGNVANAGALTAADKPDHNPTGITMPDGSGWILHGDTTADDGNMVIKLTPVPWMQAEPKPEPEPTPEPVDRNATVNEIQRLLEKLR